MTSREVRGFFNGIHLKPFLELAGRRAHDPKSVEFLAVGDLGHNKGTFDILQAAGRMAVDCPDCCWTFIGRGDLPAVEQMARELGLEGRVRFAGAVDEEAKLQALGRADVFLLPSYAEGQPLSILEAMAAGLPVVSSTVGSIPEVVGEENGALVEPGDVDALEEGMRRLATDAGLRHRIAAANVEAARSRFDVRRLHREIGEAYLELSQGGHRSRRRP
jgi:glycosyltransferase involved in cell wall biosynthesis